MEEDLLVAAAVAFFHLPAKGCRPALEDVIHDATLFG
jgi:hypothetical protein